MMAETEPTAVAQALTAEVLAPLAVAERVTREQVEPARERAEPIATTPMKARPTATEPALTALATTAV